MKIYQIGFQMKKINKNYRKMHLILEMQFKELYRSKKIQNEYMNNKVLYKIILKLLVVILMREMKIFQIFKIWILLSLMLIQKRKLKNNSQNKIKCLNKMKYLNKIVLIHQMNIQEIILIIQKKTLRICQKVLKKILKMILMKALRNNLVLTMNRI